MSLRYLVVGDLHLDVKAPSRKRVDDYEKACFDKLYEITRIAKEESCELIVVTGDWFHRKAPVAVPHYLVLKTLTWLRHCDDLGLKVLTVAGNHDVQYNDFSQASIEKQPFGILLAGAAGILIDLSSNPEPVCYASREGYIFTGSSYRKPVRVLNELVEDTTQFAPRQFHGSPARIHICHASVVDKAPAWKPYTLIEDVFKATTADVIHCGHIHDYIGALTGVNSLGRRCYFTNAGSLTRGALTEENIERKPVVLVATFDESGTFNLVKRVLVHQPSDVIYDISAYRQEKTKVATANAWAQQLRREFGQAEIEANESFEDLITQSGALDHRTRELARGILDEVGE